MLLEKVFVGIDHAPHNFDVCSRVLGQGGANLDFIRSETGAMVILKGGSGDKINPLHIALNHSRSDRLATARTLAVNLVESVRQEFLQWSAQNPPTPAPAPVIPSLNVPPPSLNVAPNTLTAMPPPSLQVPQQALNVVPMPQVLQLVPQQQIFVGPDGTHYVKVTFAQTPTGNTIPATAMSMGQVGVAMQPPPQIQAYAPPPIQTYAAPHVQQQPQVEVLNGMVASPSVCAAPTLSTHSTTQREPQWDRGPANALQHQLAMHANNVPVVQPWATAPPQVAPVPAPVQVNTAAPPPVNPAPNLWAPPASFQQQTSNRPWGEPMNQPAQQQQQHHQQQQQPQQQQQQQQHQQQQQQQQQQPQPQPQQQTTPQNPLQESSLGGNIPWYKNSQNTASAAPNQISDLKPPRRFDAMWAEGEDQNNSGTSVPVWAVGSVTPKNALPDLREEIMKEKEEMGEVVNERRSPRRNRDRRMDNRGPRRDNRRDRRREHRRPYTDAEVYRRQFRSAGVLGEERNAGDENNAMLMNEDDGGEASPPEQSSNDNGGAGPSPDGNRGADEYPERPADRQPPRGGNVGASPDQGQASKWDRQERSVGTGQYNTPTTHYNINNHYTQSAPPQYNTAGSYNQPQNPTQQQQQQSGQYGQTPYKQGSGGSQQTSQQPSGTDNQPTSYDKHSQSVGSNSQSPSSYNWANAQQSQQYQAERGQWGPTQHPWNQRGGESGGNAQVGGQYGERPWGNRASMMPPPPPPPPATETQHQPAASNYWSGAY